MTDKGHLRLPNELVEALAELRLNGSQWQILWSIWRMTLCWQVSGEWSNRAYPIGISDIVDGTGLNKSNVKREMSELVKYNIIFRDRSPDGEKPSAGGRGHKPMTSFNLDPATWILPIKGSRVETLSDSPERVVEPLPFDNQKGSEEETLNKEGKGSEEETLNTGKGSRSEPQRDAEQPPFTNQSETLSPREMKLGKKHLKKHKETEDIKKPSLEGDELAHLLKSLILRNNPKAKTPGDITKWALDIDKMLNIDRRTPKEIKFIIEFSQNDSFWCANILSVGKLRDKFDQLYLRAKEKGGSHVGRGQPGRGTDAHREAVGERGKFSGFHAIESGPDQPEAGDED